MNSTLGKVDVFEPSKIIYCLSFAGCHDDAQAITTTSAESRNVKIDTKKAHVKTD